MCGWGWGSHLWCCGVRPEANAVDMQHTDIGTDMCDVCAAGVSDRVIRQQQQRAIRAYTAPTNEDIFSNSTQYAVRRAQGAEAVGQKAHRASTGHIEHVCGLSPVWVRSCGWNIALAAEPPGAHRASVYGFSPVWVRSCLGTALLSPNRRGHTEHPYGFSPVWIRSCVVALLWCLGKQICSPRSLGASIKASRELTF